MKYTFFIQQSVNFLGYVHRRVHAGKRRYVGLHHPDPFCVVRERYGLGHHLLLRLRVLDEDRGVLADERHRIVRLMVLGHVWRRDEDGRLPGGAELGDRAGA